MSNNLGFCKRVKEFVLGLDLFAIQPNLNVFKKQKYSTFLGAIMTFCIGIITIAYLASELYEFQSKSLPNIVQSEKQVVETSVNDFYIKTFPLMQDNFTLAVSVTDANFNPVKKINQYYTITINNCVRTRKLNTTTSQVDVTNECMTYPTDACTKDDFVTDTQKEFFNKTRLGTVQCIKRDILKSNPPKLKGIASGREYAYITIQFSLCKNTTTMQTCAPQEEILAGLKSGYYVVYLSDTLLQMGNRGDISQDIIKLQYTTFSISSSIIIQQSFRIVESMTDEGIIVNSDQSDYKLIQQGYKEQSSLYNDEFLVNHQIILDYKSTQYQRSYIKLQAILSKIGGLWQILFLGIAIIIKPFIETDMYLRICNQIFRIEKEDSKNYNEKTKSNVSQKIEQLSPKFHNSILETILITLNCNRKKKSHFQIAKAAFLAKIDVVDIASKSFQQDQLKQILFNEEQKRLFDCIPRPLIHFDTGNLMDFFVQSVRINDALFIERKNNTDEQFEMASKSYFKIMQRGIDDFDKRLLAYLDQDIIQLFHQIHQTKNNSQIEISFDFQKKDSVSQRRGYQSRISLSQGSKNQFDPIPLESPAPSKVSHNKGEI